MSMLKAAQKQSKLLVRLWCTSVALVLCAGALPVQADGKILKWKDEKGVTHYGDQIPPQYANRESTSISQHGIAVKRNIPSTVQDQELQQTKQMQDKKDKALLAAFTSESEIDLALDRNMQADMIALDSLQQDKTNLLKRILEDKKSIDALIKQKKKVPSDLTTELATNQIEAAKLDQRIAERKQALENIRQRFEQDKQRYISLKNNTADTKSAESPLSDGTKITNTPNKTMQEPAAPNKKAQAR